MFEIKENVTSSNQEIDAEEEDVKHRDQDGEIVKSSPQLNSNYIRELETEENIPEKHLSSEQDEEVKSSTSVIADVAKLENVNLNEFSLLAVNDDDKKLSGESVRNGTIIQSSIKNKCEGQSQGRENVGIEEEEEENENEDVSPPALPPRPPRPRPPCTCTRGPDGTHRADERSDRRMPRSCWSSGLRKYVFLCTACGSLSIILGALFLVVYFMLKSYTSSLNYFETIPTYVPSGMLVATGFLIICLAWRKNRNNFLMKLCGLCSLCCAVLCVSVTVTTTVIHMNRLQILRECLYTQKTQSCTCYSMVIDSNRISDEGIKFVFNSTPDCEVIHGALYSCLRAVFGLSVIGILVCIFGCMLVYQLLGHEKKKMYWAQLEMRCRYLYRQQRNPHYYACCDECRYPPHSQFFPWEFTRNRFWSAGRIGNLYTPNPEDRSNHQRLRSGWNWRRLPWSRNGGADGPNNPVRGSLESPDSQYGFNSSTVEGAPYTVLDPRAANGIPICHSSTLGADITEDGFYSWGPPPPYASNRNSANNSPARRSLGELFNQMSPVRRNDNVSPARNGHHIHCHHMHHSRRCTSSPRQVVGGSATIQPDSYQKSMPVRNLTLNNIIQQDQPIGMNTLWSNSLSAAHPLKPVITNKDNYENMYETDPQFQSIDFNTLPGSKNKNSTKMNNKFSNESFTAYFLSTANNAGSTSHNESQNINAIDNPPTEMELTNEQYLNISRNESSLDTAVSGSSFKSETLNQSSPFYDDEEKTAVEPMLKSVGPTDSNISVPKRLLVNYSPNQNQKILIQNPVQPAFEKKEVNPIFSKMVSNETLLVNQQRGPPEEGSSERVTTCQYKTSISTSSKTPNFEQPSDKMLEAIHLDRISCSQSEKNEKDQNEYSLNEKTLNSELSPSSGHEKVTKKTKCLMRDSELLKKHKNLIQEFKTLDLGKSHQECRDNKSDEKKLGIENGIHREPEEMSALSIMTQPYSEVHHADLETSTKKYISQYHQSKNETLFNLSNYPQTNRNDSDLNLGGSSNSSSCRSEPFPKEESKNNLKNASRCNLAAFPQLSKHNSKAINFGNLKPGSRMLKTHSSSQQHGEPLKYKKHQIGQKYICPNGQHQRKFQAEISTEKDMISNSTKLVSSTKNQSGGVLEEPPHNELPESQIKYSTALPSFYSMKGSCLQSNHRHEFVNSSDQHSYSSVTTTVTGISSSKNHSDSKRLENSSGEINCLMKNGESAVQNLLTKHSNLESLGDFVHPLFQKPKILSGSQYKEENLNRKKAENLEPTNDLARISQKPNTLMYGPEGFTSNNFEDSAEEVSNHLLSTCNHTLTSEYLSEEDNPLLNYFEKSNGTDQTTVRNGEGVCKSFKPLSRTSFSNKPFEEDSSKEQGCPKSSRVLQRKEKTSNTTNSSGNRFLAPDAQYEIQNSFDPETKSKTYQISGNKTKPPISTRPPHLLEEHKKPVKLKGSSTSQLKREGNDKVRPTPKERRKNVSDVADGKEMEINGNHFVNV